MKETGTGEDPGEDNDLKQLTERVIGCAYRVSNALGCGFVEKVYENALAIELKKAGLDVEQQKRVDVYYERSIVGEFVADMLVEGRVLIEVKAVEDLILAHTGQCINYLRATGLKICLLLNFGRPKVQVKRVVQNL